MGFYFPPVKIEYTHMDELITEAIILGSRSWPNGDRQVDLFTKELGRVAARARAGMNTTSKLSPHLDALNLSEVRLKNHGSHLLTDALTKTRFRKLRKDPAVTERALEVLNLVNLITPFNLKDLELWHYLLQSMESAAFDGEALLRVLGYDPKLANCEICGGMNVSHFIPLDQFFSCGGCLNKTNGTKLFRI